MANVHNMGKNRHWLELVSSSTSRIMLRIGGFTVSVDSWTAGMPTSEVTFFYAIKHIGYRITAMKLARSWASASLKDKKKIYVFGGCWDVADSSNWVEVFDLETRTWEFLFLFTPKMPLNIQQRVVINGQIIYGVDEDGQIFYFTPSTNPMFMTNGIVEPNPENRNE